MGAPRSFLKLAAAVSMGACVHVAHQESHAHWSYEGREGPPAWGHLAADYHTCADGRHQSPVNIDVEQAEAAPLPDLRVHYGPVSVTEVNNGHTIQDSVAAGDFVELGETQYALQQFHFHHPSEHTLDGEHAPLEIHFVHKDASGALLVMGVFVNEGAENPLLRTLFERLPRDHDAVQLSADPSLLLPADSAFVEYEGSLTTPPCSEGVTWLVMAKPISASAEQIEKFAQLYPHNNRPLMPLNDRHLLSSRGP